MRSLLLIAVVLAAGCSASAQRAEPWAASMPVVADHQEPELGPEEALERARQELASIFEVGEVEIERLDEVPGVHAFRGFTRSAAAARDGWVVLMVEADAVHIGPRATQAVLRRWRRGELGRSLLPVVRALAFLESTVEATAAVLTEEDIDELPAAWRPHVFVPRRTVIDGQPTLEYWVRSGEPPLWLSQIMIRDDGSYLRRIKEIGDLL